MPQGSKGKKMVSLSEKKGVVNTARTTISREAEQSYSTIARMEAVVAHDPRDYSSQKKATLSNQMKSAIKKLLRKDKPRKKKKRTAPCPILGAVLKYHKDDEVDSAAAGGAA